MASNTNQAQDPQGDYDDWIELYNGSTETVDLSGAYLTDDLDRPTTWRFPEGTILPAGGHLLIWADRDIDAEGLHANFALSAGGEAIGLFAADGATLLDSIEFGTQVANISTGRFPDGDPLWRFMAESSAGQANVGAFEGFVEAVEFSVERGFYEGPISLSLSTPTPDAEIWYTTDTSDPAKFATGRVIRRQGDLYAGPIEIGTTTCVRAVAIKPGWKDSPLTAHSYLYLEAILRQPSRPPGSFPTSWGAQQADYAMDQRITEDEAYRDEMIADFLAIPSVSLVIANDDMFGAQGIYANPNGSGERWERLVTMEWFDPNRHASFAVNAGLRIHGGQFSRTGNIKKAMRLLFKTQYGPSTLNYPLFEDTDTEVFNTLVLRSIWNYSWTGADSNPARATYLRDVFARDTVRDMGRLSPYGRPVHVYINGLYWGLHIMTERPDERFAAAHLGGVPEDYDVVKASNNTSIGIETVAGERVRWDQLFELADTNLSSAAAYEDIRQYVDVPAMIDYMLMIYYTGSRDAPVFLGNSFDPRNFYAIGRRTPAGPYHFAPWDVEWALENTGTNRVNVVGILNPHVLMDRLSSNARFRTELADLIHARFFNGGVLTRATVTDRYMSRVDEIFGAIVCESARWGDTLRNLPYTREDWLNEVDRLTNQYFAVRTDIVLNQLRNRGWYPNVEAPEFRIDEVYRHGGAIGRGSLLSLHAANEDATLTYTLDGTDPRSIAPQSLALHTFLPEQAAKRVWVPTADIGVSWRERLDYDDAAWIAGSGTAGFELGWDYLGRIAIDLLATMWEKNATCYLRIPFDVDDPGTVQSLYLNIAYDDGFVAYLNGEAVVRQNAPDTLTWNANATFAHEASEMGETFNISPFRARLRAGRNLLAIQGLNTSSTSPDFLISAALEGDIVSQQQQGQYRVPIALTKSIRVRAAAFDGNQWSAATEAVYSVGPILESIRITELMYHPPEPNTEYVELTNIGAEPVNLNLIRFSRGIDFTVGDLDLAPAESILVVRDIAAFEAKHGAGLPVAGVFLGSLDNAGERITLSDPLGREIVNFRYRDDWYPVTDGSGPSLVPLSPEDRATLAEGTGWAPSPEPDGSPGLW